MERRSTWRKLKTAGAIGTLVAAYVFALHELYRAFTTGEIRGRYHDVSLAADAGSFWLSVVMDAVFVALGAAALAAALWLRPKGENRLVARLARKADLDRSVRASLDPGE